MTQVQRFDTQSLNRALIGFDRMFDNMERQFANQVSTNYPPHNILKTGENLYEIQIAVTGFEKNEIAVTIESDVLTVKGEGAESVRHEQSEIVYLHRGLALRDFERSFTLAEHMKVVSAEIKNGVLTIRIEREIPEEMKPRVIDIVEIK
jgi:molecular chaperone IbpA